MAHLRLTILEPRPGCERQVKELLQELDESLSDAPGLLWSLVLNQGPKRLGRVSLWRDRDDANREANNNHVLSLRSRLRYYSLTTEERLLEASSGYMPAGFASLQDSAKLPATFSSSARQLALPAA